MDAATRFVRTTKGGCVVKLIERNGIYRISLEAYHGQPCVGPSISSSGLRTIFKKSPAHFWCESSLNPEAEPQEETDAFVLGRGAHHLLLGEDDFSTLFIVRPDELNGKPWHGNRADCKAWLDRQAEAGRTVLLASDIKHIRGMAKSLAANPLVQQGILGGDVEQSMIWKDKSSGVWLKARPDCIPTDSGDFADLKTSSRFGDDLDRDVAKYRYDMQAGLVSMACREVLKRPMQSFSFVFVESKPPYGVEVVTLKSGDVEEAEKDLRVAIDVFAHCLKTGDWFGPGGTQRDARFVHIPDWVRENAEYRRDVLKREIEPAKVKHSAADLIGA